MPYVRHLHCVLPLVTFFSPQNLLNSSKTFHCQTWFDQIKIWLFKRPPGLNSHKTFVNEFVLVLKKNSQLEHSI
jgi:hypothetical protein